MVDLNERSTEMVVDPDARLLRVTLRGRYDLRAWLDVIQAMRSVVGYEPGMDAIHDASAAHFDFTQDDVRLLAEWVRGHASEWGGEWRFASVVSSDLMYGLCRMIVSWFSDAPFEAGVFRALDEGMAWIEEGRAAG